MGFFKTRDRFKLHDDQSSNDQIDSLSRDWDPAISNIDRALTLVSNLPAFKLNGHRLPVNGLQKARPKRPMNGNRAPNRRVHNSLSFWESGDALRIRFGEKGSSS